MAKNKTEQGSQNKKQFKGVYIVDFPTRNPTFKKGDKYLSENENSYKYLINSKIIK